MAFESANQFMATLHDVGDGVRRVLLKGAPDRVLERCTGEFADGEERDLDADRWQEVIDELGADGLRVLAAAYTDADGADGIAIDDLGEEFVFVGVVGLLDPPRPEAIEAIAECRNAGIEVRMITGDHAVTAAAIAQEMGVAEGEEAVTGAQIEEASDEELIATARDHHVFARTSPEHKYRLVEALQADGQVVVEIEKAVRALWLRRSGDRP